MGKQLVILVSVVIIAVYLAFVKNDDLILTLPDGKVRGVSYVTTNNITYYGYRGIPFATPPIGDLRLERPRPAKPWSGIWDASDDGKNCISINYFQQTDVESEDCLYINVYTPTLQAEAKLPVMFWIYGGGFTQGSAQKFVYGPDFLIEENVIIVSFNYRLGPFGFLSTGDSALPGNLGLKDQNLALKWTHRNIEYFGGDPDNITIFGVSAGGASVALHLVSKQSAGLFKGAIVESGTSLNSFAMDLNPKSLAYLALSSIPGGNYGNDTQAFKDFLKTRTVEDIMTAVISRPEVQFWPPTLEEESEDAFVSESPYEALVNGNYNQVPIVIGLCAEESLMFLKDIPTAEARALSYDTQAKLIIPERLFPKSEDETVVIEKIRNIYLKEGETFSNNLTALAEYVTDDMFARGIVKHAELASTRVPVYLYQFAYFGRPLTQAFIDGAEKAGHAAELPFVFKFLRLQSTDLNDLLVQKRIVTLWTNFAKYLNPTPTESDLLGNIKWPAFDNETPFYLNINNTLEVRANIRGNSYSKWNDIFETYGRKPFVTF